METRVEKENKLLKKRFKDSNMEEQAMKLIGRFIIDISPYVQYMEEWLKEMWEVIDEDNR